MKETCWGVDTTRGKPQFQRMAFDRDQIKKRAAELAARNVYVGTSSWKYELCRARHKGYFHSGLLRQAYMWYPRRIARMLAPSSAFISGRSLLRNSQTSPADELSPVNNSPFRPAGRRTAQAGRLCHPRPNFQTRSKSPRQPKTSHGDASFFIADRAFPRDPPWIWR